MINNSENTFYSEAFARSIAVIGREAVEALRCAKVLVCGVGGVGSYAAAALARSGTGTIGLLDVDSVSVSNINRQLVANVKTLGQKKTTVMAAMIQDINPHCHVEEYIQFLDKTNIAEIIGEKKFDYVIDCIDTVTSKLDLIVYCKSKSISIVSSMGTGKKLHPELLELEDIYKTTVCPLAKVMRKELKKRGVISLTVCYSKELPVSSGEEFAEKATSEIKQKRAIVGSMPFVPPVSGMILAGKVVRDLTGF